MSPSTPKTAARQPPVLHRKPLARDRDLGHSGQTGGDYHVPARTAVTLAALGDRTRLSLLTKLSGGARSISQLTHGSHLTRQAITKHLRVLERAQIVRCTRSGRHRFFEIDPEPVRQLRDYLDHISAEWDTTLDRLKSLVENEAPAAPQS